jgi:hypothetical protein
MPRRFSLMLIWMMALPLLWLIDPWRCEACALRDDPDSR